MTVQPKEPPAPTPAPAGAPPAGQQPGQGAQPQKTTVASLFPDHVDKDGNIHGVPVRELNPGEVPGFNAPGGPAKAPEPTPTPPAPTPPAQPPADPNAKEYVQVKDLEGKFVRLKVDGVEQDVPADSLIKVNQLERHLREEERRFHDERAAWEREKNEFLSRQTDGQPPKPGEGGVPPAPAGAPMPDLPPEWKKRFETLEAQNKALMEATAPARQEHVVNQLADYAKSKFGEKAADFKDYIPKIKALAIEKASAPGLTVQQRAQYDTADFYLAEFVRMKLNGEAPTAQPPAPPATPPADPQGGRPPAPPPPPIEGSGGAPPAGSGQDSWEARYNAAFERATKSGSIDDWTAVQLLKMERQS